MQVNMEERFCELVKGLGCTCVTISHRPALMAFHDLVLALDGEGGWSLHQGARAAPAGHAAMLACETPVRVSTTLWLVVHVGCYGHRGGRAVPAGTPPARPVSKPVGDCKVIMCRVTAKALCTGHAPMLCMLRV